jgi:hypothetical protein
MNTVEVVRCTRADWDGAKFVKCVRGEDWLSRRFWPNEVKRGRVVSDWLREASAALRSEDRGTISRMQAAAFRAAFASISSAAEFGKVELVQAGRRGRRQRPAR